MHPLNITITDTSVILQGELDMATAPLVRDALKALVGLGKQPLVIDLADVTFIDAAGLRVLLEGRALFAGEHRHLVLVNPSRTLRRVAEILEITEQLGW